jgi:hypothetical protein
LTALNKAQHHIVLFNPKEYNGADERSLPFSDGVRKYCDSYFPNPVHSKEPEIRLTRSIEMKDTIRNRGDLRALGVNLDVTRSIEDNIWLTYDSNFESEKFLRNEATFGGATYRKDSSKWWFRYMGQPVVTYRGMNEIFYA